MRPVLSELERQMVALNLWSSQSPERDQLASMQPFCVDTMVFEQWLQWIFIPRMRLLADQDAPLPGDCQIEPIGEQSFLRLGGRRHDLLAVLAHIDRLASGLR